MRIKPSCTYHTFVLPSGGHNNQTRKQLADEQKQAAGRLEQATQRRLEASTAVFKMSEEMKTQYLVCV
jgi:hypothetical protein